MSLKRHCDTCGGGPKPGGSGIPRPWITVTLTEPDTPRHSAFDRHWLNGPLKGEYCSIECLAHKMQASEPTAREQMLAVLNITESP